MSYNEQVGQAPYPNIERLDFLVFAVFTMQAGRDPLNADGAANLVKDRFENFLQECVMLHFNVFTNLADVFVLLRCLLCSL